jgi:nuclear migration protein JNM1
MEKKKTTVRNSDSDDESNPDIDRNTLNTDEARLHFLRASGVDAREVDFSDTIAAKRKAYKNRSTRRRRRQQNDGDEGVDEASDSEEEESLERKLARLRRETEELKEDMQQQQQKDGSAGGAEAGADEDGLLELSKALDTIQFASARANSQFPDAILSQKLEAASTDKQPATTTEKDSKKNDAGAAAAGLLAHAASFDSRLALLEAALGVSSGSNPFIAENSTAEPSLHPILPALDHLTSQLTALTSTLGGPAATTTTSFTPATSTPASTTAHLEALSTRLKKLTTDAESLANARRRASEAAAKAAASNVRSPDLADNSSSNATEVNPNNNNNAESSAQRDEQVAKIHALYATLPTIQSLHPVLPSVLERLRSLRALHAGAAQASETLDALEKDQAEMSKEIEQWREGLRVVEEKVKESEGAMKSNIDMVGPWVKDLEARIARFD